MTVPTISVSKSQTSKKVKLVIDGDEYDVNRLEIGYSPESFYPTVKIVINASQ